MEFDEAQYEAYNEWAETELIWGKGMFNWCKSYTKDDWKKPSIFKSENEIDVSNHPLCRFGG